MRYAFDLAMQRNKQLTSVDKANVLTDVYGLWRDVFTEVASDYPEVKTEFNFVDAVTMWFVKNPEWFDVVVTPNMFGDIITDLGAMIQGGLGLAPGGNINPEGISMFEPIHGSAPKYKGMNVANPVATIWAGSMLLDNLGEHEAAAAVLSSIEHSIAKGVTTKDMGGSAGTSDVGDWIGPMTLVMCSWAADFRRNPLLKYKTTLFNMKVANATFIKQCMTLRGHARFQANKRNL